MFSEVNGESFQIKLNHLNRRFVYEDMECTKASEVYGSVLHCVVSDRTQVVH